MNTDVNLLRVMLTDNQTRDGVNRVWERISANFLILEDSMPNKLMKRRELSFHDHIKLLGFLCLSVYDLEGDIIEIGVWKGKSLSFMREFASSNTRLIGIDPCELEGQALEIDYFQKFAFPEAQVIKQYSHDAFEAVVGLTHKVKILHIDGGHTSKDVWRDFLLYERLVVEGGFIIFDDYNDLNHSPEVHNAVDSLARHGFFKNYEIFGALEPFGNSFVLKRKRS